MFKILKYLTKRDWFFVAITVGALIGGVWFELKLPEYMAEITRLIQIQSNEISEVTRIGVSMLVVSFISGLITVLTGFLIARIAANFARNLREKIYTKTINYTKEEINLFSIPSLITRSTNDITQITNFVAMGLGVTVRAPIMGVLAVIKMMDKNFQWSLATGITVLILLCVFAVFLVMALPKFKKIQKLTDDVNRVSRETISGVRVVRAYNAQEYQETKFNAINDALTGENIFVSKVFALLHPIMNLLMMGLSLVIYLIGASLISQAITSDKLLLFSEMIVFSSYATQVIMAFVLIIMSFVLLPRASISAKRLEEVFTTESTIAYGIYDKFYTAEKPIIEFKNVRYKYPGAEENTLDNISFSVNKGETLAIIGATGSGKTTLIDLIPRFFDPTGGSIEIEGLDIKSYTKEALSKKIGYVSQKSVLFSDSVTGNIAYGENEKSIDKKRVIQSSKIAMAHDFINAMENGYDSSISQGGTNLSGGQKQRISIARAMYKNPDIFIFDDSFSALDYKTDSQLRKNIKEQFAHATNIIVAQRVGTIMDADKIIVLEDGKIAGIGNHTELLKNCTVYTEIVLSQFSEEEVL